ncbi:MAG: Ribonuclease 3 [Candidatus Wolfebacteria bacterium GW2011_GWC1_43_10]|uniref:Ribonuclease 3 n=2 Tax=Candidatus Wolfeibacteriota TaxID=1752735 RepID=A0A0G1EIL0_9BACT|nr:MAG: Ribonuclease 3 [Candidatus Wolfebacteria bacterium GW2011_GWC1_43_10]KKT22769.1 MAG: Ribonuclease 3 [Parcubacteria group bacterium GW2011_GWB1_43_8b]OGM90231.1 MAG: ribonuclease III [Candidatus Wolfebacteria bacterium GWA1_42_9]
MNLADLQEKIGVHFKNEDLLKEALTHRSYLNENPSWPLPHNERLEFLGDAVLELIVTENLFSAYPQDDEGKLTSVRAALVNYLFLSSIAKSLSMEDYIWMSKGEAKDTGRARNVILANAFEALLGAIYLDQGYSEASQFIKKFVFSKVSEVVENGLYKDAKSFFQELAQEKYKTTPVYQVLEEIGPDHQKTFRVGLFLGEEKISEGEGFSKQEAEIEAAKKGLLYVFEKTGN